MNRSLPVSLSRQITATSRLSVATPNDLVTNASRIASEPSPDTARGYYSFDISKEQVIV
jgi:hypothetical protein